MIRTALCVLTLAAAAARADVAEWFWTFSDTGNADGLIEPGEAALISLHVAMDPGAVGIAGTNEYTISGNAAWAAGGVENRLNRIDSLGVGPGVLHEDTNTISAIAHFQFSLFYNVEFDPGNPVTVYTMRWTPDFYTPREVTLDCGATAVWVWLDDLDTLEYTPIGGRGSFHVVPAPAPALCLFAAACCSAHRRR